MSDERGDQANRQPTDGWAGLGVGEGPIRGTRGGVRKRRARRRGARAHAAAEGDHVPPPPPRAAGGGGRPGRGLTDEVERVVGGRDRLVNLCDARSAPVERSPPPLPAPCVAVGGRPPPTHTPRPSARAASTVGPPLARPAQELDASTVGVPTVAGGVRRAGVRRRAGARGPPLAVGSSSPSPSSPPPPLFFSLHSPGKSPAVSAAVRILT